MSAVVQDPQEVFRSCQKRLGSAGRLGISALLFDSSGEIRCHIGFKEDDRFPMASVVKVPIAMFIASDIENGTLSLDERITFHSRCAAPGLIGNPLDRFYFLPFDTVRTNTVDELMGFMLHHSDNTATDAILKRLGGIGALTNFVRDLEIEGIVVTRTMAELLNYYYALKSRIAAEAPYLRVARRTGMILANTRRMIPAFRCRAGREENLVRSGEETCPPRAMARLLRLVATDPKYCAGLLAYAALQDRHAENRGKLERSPGVRQELWP